MSKKIIIEAGSVSVEAELNDTETAGLIWEALPIEARANTWGDEVYFDVPVTTGLENAHEIVEIGDLGYWPQGPAFCIFFGPTPMSVGDEIRPASAVNVVGRTLADATVFRAVSPGDTVKLTAASRR